MLGLLAMVSASVFALWCLARRMCPEATDILRWGWKILVAWTWQWPCRRLGAGLTAWLWLCGLGVLVSVGLLGTGSIAAVPCLVSVWVAVYGLWYWLRRLRERQFRPRALPRRTRVHRRR